MQKFKTEKALVLSSKRLGERAFIISLLTLEHGKHLGVYQKMTPPDIGTFVSAQWQARLSEQLGRFYLEETCPFSIQFLDDRHRLACLSSLCALLDELLPERQTFPEIYDLVFSFLNTLKEDDFLKNYILLETELLSAIGFGLDLSCCAGGGDSNHLAYVSPKTGRAVSLEKGLPYQDKLLRLPLFLWKEAPASTADLIDGLNLTGYFLTTFALKHALPKVRELLYKI